MTDTQRTLVAAAMTSFMVFLLSLNSPPIWAAIFMAPTFFLICLIWLAAWRKP